MKDNILRICLVLLIVFLLSFRLVSEIKREVSNRKIWVEVFRKINRWDLEGDLLYWKSIQFEPDEGDTLYFISKDLEDTFWIVEDTNWIVEDTGWIFWDTNIPDRRFNENHR